MISISNKSKCCGCTACESICPQECITMKPDKEGFVYPIVNEVRCVDCGLCEKICPILTSQYIAEFHDALAGIIQDENIRITSSSGGIFWALSSHVIDKGGIVFGASFDKNWNVVHTEAKTIEQLISFKGSKYVQSSVSGVYRRVKDYLTDDKLVMFTGTPCQIAGLRSFLRKVYSKLYLVEIACHGVPSPQLWQSYLQSLKNDIADEIKRVEFRNKSHGWRLYRLRVVISRYNIINREKIDIISEQPKKNLYLRLFRSNLSLRPSCYDCKFKSGNSGADITLGDYWGLPQTSRFNDDKGASVIVVYTEKGKHLLSEVHSLSLDVVEYEHITKHNHCLVGSVSMPESRNEFWKLYNSNGLDGVRNFTIPGHKDNYGDILKSFKRIKRGIIERIIGRVK